MSSCIARKDPRYGYLANGWTNSGHYIMRRLGTVRPIAQPDPQRSLRPASPFVVSDRQTSSPTHENPYAQASGREPCSYARSVPACVGKHVPDRDACDRIWALSCFHCAVPFFEAHAGVRGADLPVDACGGDMAGPVRVPFPVCRRPGFGAKTAPRCVVRIRAGADVQPRPNTESGNGGHPAGNASAYPSRKGTTR